ncbi:hypothetical protein BDV11DRAFT_196141 [Aspergillus similis]
MYAPIQGYVDRDAPTLDGLLLPCGHNAEGPAHMCGHTPKKQVGFVELHAISIDSVA